MKPLANWLCIVAAFTAPGTAYPVENNTLVGDPCWAQFCSDDACSENCGNSLQLSDTHCWNEWPRKSIKFHGAPYGPYAIIISPSYGCPCQTTCKKISQYGLPASGCLNMSEFGADMSYRFISGWCPANNC
ncbi:hypothetical protein GGR57DRAFT_520783 [Xylariaceae sp. FL1272]|nr:hypothetical protein GGR57DRAFT_520783 [Xylariaceae sp. FL1272]